MVNGFAVLRVYLGIALVALACAWPIKIRADVPPVVPCSLTTTTATVCKTGPGVLYGVFNNSTGAQTGTVLCYDNATAASGTVVMSSAALGQSQSFVLPAPRIFTNGLTCISSASVTGSVDIFRI